MEQAGRTLEHALAAHGVETRLVGMAVGPTVTRFELELGPGVKVARVTSLHRDIAYAMASPDVRILAPIPGRSAIGVEVPNQQRQLVAVGDILVSDEAQRAAHPCEVAVGRDISGRAVMANLADMPHLLIAGATGAGKSSCINSLLTSILVRSTPDEVRLILVDPKRVELGQYGGVPHLLAAVVVDPKKKANALAWAVRRWSGATTCSPRSACVTSPATTPLSTAASCARPRAEGVDDPGETLHVRLPFIVVVVDELNDLMMVAARDVEESICRIAQKARAVGIHLVIATQRPSVNVITGVIKANILARLAFAVSSLADSRVILDQAGAERLVGQGDMLLLGATSSSAQRIQGAWVATAPWAYVKVAEGCDRACGFCAIPSFRGPQRSRTPSSILAEVLALGEGVREIVLVAQDLAAYGRDQGRGHRGIVPLVQAVAERVDRVRLLYLYPSDLTDGLVEAMCASGVPYFDLSLQHVSRPLLRAMRRWGDGDRFLARMDDIRRLQPEAAFRSNFIVGYPGETEDDHDALLAFLETARLDWCGFFAWSPEEGTAAAGLRGRVDGGLVAERLAECRRCQDAITAEGRDALVGRDVEVLVDQPGVGRTYREAPEIDGVVHLPQTLRVGQLATVRVEASLGPDLVACGADSDHLAP